MDDHQSLYINELSPEESELLRLAGILKQMGKDPVKILQVSIDAGATLNKAASLGKEAVGYFRRQWQVFEQEYKNARDSKDDDK